MRAIANYLLALTALVLLVLHWHLRQPAAPVSQPAVAPAMSAPAAAVPVERAALPVAAPATEAAQTNLAPASASRPTFDWASIEVSDYNEYVKRLKAVGFPQELIREIVIADLDKLYEAREQALKPQPVPFDAPLARRSTLDISPEEWQRIKDLRDLRVEKQTALEHILGEYVPREILRTPISRNYEAYEYALSQVPPEKRDYVQWAQEREIFTEGYNKTTIQDPAAELESFKRTRQERDQEMLKILTPEEFDRYEMNTTPAGTELARRVIGMEPTDEEFQAMFRIAYKNWLDTGGVYGRWRAMPVSGEQIAAADQAMNDSLKQVLGSERFLDYQLAISGTGQQLRNFAARFELPRETLAQAFQLQTQIDQLSRTRIRTVNPDGSTSEAPLPQLGDLQAQFQQLLSPELWQHWLAGKDLRANLDP